MIKLRGSSTLDRVVKLGLSEELIFDLRPEAFLRDLDFIFL